MKSTFHRFRSKDGLGIREVLREPLTPHYQDKDSDVDALMLTTQSCLGASLAGFISPGVISSSPLVVEECL